ncbi:hypothetical protein WJX73_003892 [Symbiochloris irregularis]|uniref:Methyltransferase type 11 domain-containing protein n=1 Tax=Symbiochloris irregularis TaxID=706552 RepID=A0AAW1P7I3_9CHLO
MRGLWTALTATARNSCQKETATNLLRRICTSGACQRASDEGQVQQNIFDRAVKRSQRDRAAALQAGDLDPLTDAVADNILDRLDDCRPSFPTIAVVGGATLPILTKLATSRHATGSVLVLDESPAMLRRTKLLVEKQASNVPWSQIHYIEADAEFLPLQEKSLDAVISCLSLHWVNDVPGAMAQMRRALKPDGLFLAAMWGGDTLHELRVALALAEQTLEGGVSQRMSPLAQVRDAGNLLTRAGYSIPSVDTDDVTVHYSSPMHLVRHLRAMGESNAATGRQPRLKQATWQAAESKYVEMFGAEDGSVPATFQAIYMTGWAPAPKQARPAPRGSATLSFEDLEKTLANESKGEAPKPSG